MRSLILLLLSLPLAAQTPNIDEIFAAYAKPDSPGCAVGVARAGEVMLERGYGMANLEYDAPITPSTIFEAGSVTKQFTAQAIVLLARDGKLSLDDRVIKYIPELDASAREVTIRQMLSHTSGLRDWGVVVDLEGWRRGSRLFTMKHVLDVVARQRALNFPPGTEYSYSNTGYNLAAIIVERVSGKSFPEFTRERIFVPQGMTHSSWRDDYTRVVKGRATAYDPAAGGGYESDMDIENIYGNCCLLTTVGDLLKFKPLPEQWAPMKLTSGSAIDYGLGLMLREGGFSHSGATAGYRAYLAHDNATDTSVAVLCNRGDATTGAFVEKVFSAFGVAPQPLPKAAGDAHAPSGLYRDMKTNAILYIEDDRAGERKGAGARLVPIGNNTFRAGRTVQMHFDDAGLHLMTGHKPEALYVRVPEATTPKLNDYVGTYTSDEARATYTIAIDGDHLVAKLPPVRQLKMTPTYADGFEASGDLIHFTRDAKGRVDGFEVKAAFSPVDGSARVERMRFTK
jgi:CubicO group peptidase (beta-lactamase class C family)